MFIELVVHLVNILIYFCYRSYYAPVIGTKGVTRKRIEDETKTQIRIPQRQSADEDVGKLNIMLNTK